MSGQYENPVKLRISFDAPETTEIILQGPALEAFYAYTAGDIDEDEFTEKILDQCEEHIAAWTFIRDWDYAR